MFFHLFGSHQNPPFADNGRHATVSVLCHLFAQFNANNADNWNNAEIPICAEMIDSSVSCWFFVLYKKTQIFFPEDFKPLVSFYIKPDLFPSDK